jgi:predicted DNA-binding protein
VTTTLTFRLDSEQREKLQRKARLLGKSESEFLREILQREIEERPMSQALKKVKGSLSLKARKPTGWRQTIQQHNWRS